jgi:hypothetical protein
MSDSGGKPRQRIKDILCLEQGAEKTLQVYLELAGQP